MVASDRKVTLDVLLHRYHRGYFNEASSEQYEISCQAELEIRTRFLTKSELIRMLWKKLMRSRQEVSELRTLLYGIDQTIKEPKQEYIQ